MMKRIFLLTVFMSLPSLAWADAYQAGYSYGYDNGPTITNSSQFNAGAEASDLDRAMDDAALERQNQDSSPSYLPNYLQKLQGNN